MPQHKKSPNVGNNDEFPIARKEEALNSRKRGGEFVPAFPAEQSIIEATGDFPRNTEGKTNKVPLQVTRVGERRF